MRIPANDELFEAIDWYGVRYYLDLQLGQLSIGKIDSATIRRWYGTIGQGPRSAVTSAKAYRLLRQILSAAVDDRLIRVNPCNVKGAAVERSAERRIPTLDDLLALAEADTNTSSISVRPKSRHRSTG